MIRTTDLHRLTLALAACTILMAGLAQAQTDQPTVRQVLDRCVAATGGDALADRTSMTVHGTFSIPGQGLSGAMVTRAQAPDKVLVNIEIPGFGTVRSGYRDGIGWSIDPAMGAQLMHDQALAQLQDQANFDANLFREEDYQSLSLQGEEVFSETPCWKVEVVSQAGLPSTYFFAKDSGLLIGIQAEQHTPMGPISATSFVSEYQEFDGVTMATRTEMRVMGTVQLITIESVDFEPLDDEVFALPPEIVALSTPQE